MKVDLSSKSLCRGDCQTPADTSESMVSVGKFICSSSPNADGSKLQIPLPRGLPDLVRHFRIDGFCMEIHTFSLS